MIMMSLDWGEGCSDSRTPEEHSRPTSLEHLRRVSLKYLPATARYVTQRLTGPLAYPEGLPVQLDHWSIPSASFHGAHMDSPTGRSAMTIDPAPHLRYNHPETDWREHRGKRQQLRWYG
jgi:hypothetical protein